MRACRCAWFSILLLGAAPISARAQAAAEAALGAGRAAAMASPLKEAGKRLGGAIDNAGRALETGKAPERAHPVSTVVRASAPPRPKRESVSWEDPAGIKTGMAYEEVLRRFGPPLFMLTGASGARTLSYEGNGASVDVEVSEGKVVSIRMNRGTLR